MDCVTYCPYFFDSLLHCPCMTLTPDVDDPARPRSRHTTPPQHRASRHPKVSNSHRDHHSRGRAGSGTHQNPEDSTASCRYRPGRAVNRSPASPKPTRLRRPPAETAHPPLPRRRTPPDITASGGRRRAGWRPLPTRNQLSARPVPGRDPGRPPGTGSTAAVGWAPPASSGRCSSTGATTVVRTGAAGGGCVEDADCGGHGSFAAQIACGAWVRRQALCARRATRSRSFFPRRRGQHLRLPGPLDLGWL